MGIIKIDSLVKKNFRISNSAIYISVLILTIYATRVIVRNTEWKNNKTLWEANAKIYPLSPRSYNNLGDVYLREGDYKKSIAAFKTAISLNPNYADAYYNLALTQLKNNEIDNAINNFELAYKFNPKLSQALFNVSYLYTVKKDSAMAKEDADKFKDIQPSYEKLPELFKRISDLESRTP